MDGSQKLPQRLIAPILARRAKGEVVAALILAVAAWMRWQSGVDDAGTPFTIEDPLAAETRAALAGTDSAAQRVAALLALPAIFPPALAQDAGLVTTLTEWLERLESGGALAAIGGGYRGFGSVMGGAVMGRYHHTAFPPPLSTTKDGGKGGPGRR